MEFTQEELKAIRAEYAKGSTDTQFDLFMMACRTRDLRPGDHLVFQLRRSKEYDTTTGAYVFVQKPYWITTISALLLIAERTKKYDGATSPEYIYLDESGDPTVVSEIPLPNKEHKTLPREPWAVRVKVRRKDFSEPITSIVRFDAVAATQKTDNGIVLTEMWRKRGPEQNAKCSLANAIRICFPEEAGQLFLTEELKNEVEEAPQPQVALAAAPTAPVVPKVDQTPAIPTDAPRPNEIIPTLEEIVLHKEPSLPVETKPKTTRKKAEPKIPDNGKPEDPHGITQADIDAVDNPVHKETPEEKAQREKEGQEFAEDVGGATPVPDRLPTDEQKKEYTARIRAMVAEHKVDSKSLGIYVVSTLSGKQKSGELTVGNWESAFEKLDAAATAGTLKELVKQ